ncbi:hypothetical protein E2C01_056512 [Portunus trituberculatus]|uniref:Uncharacterized protein n=1 Tax=Portunus trituberculatus TaxID=210409 RepID=A0A5B7GZD5_PORTR|nr:hypothetical protein [Portunus trituberculatus]
MSASDAVTMVSVWRRRLCLGDWPRLLTQNTFAISFISSSDGDSTFIHAWTFQGQDDHQQDESATKPAGSSSLGPF